MATIGTGAPILDKKARQMMTQRRRVNPLDVTTIVSIYPKEIHETKATLFPGYYVIPAGTLDTPSLTHIGASSWWKEIFDEDRMLEIPVDSITIAESIIRDYIVGIQEVEIGVRQPGLFLIPGKHTQKTIEAYVRPKGENDTSIITYQDLLNKAKLMQKGWFNRIVQKADIDWSRTNGNPLAISDDARMAAMQLGLKEKPWLGEFKHQDLINCKGCGALRNPLYPICATCGTDNDPELSAKLGISTANNLAKK